MSECHLWCVSHDLIFRTNKESSVWRQNDHKDRYHVQNLSALFIFQEECRMKIEHIIFPSVFSKLRIRVLEDHFNVFTNEPTKTGSLKTDCVKGPLGSQL